MPFDPSQMLIPEAATSPPDQQQQGSGQLIPEATNAPSAPPPRPQWTDERIPFQDRLNNLLQSHAKALRPWDETQANIKDYFPGANPEPLQKGYEQQAKLEGWRAGAQQQISQQDLGYWLNRRFAPFASPLIEAADQNAYATAREKFQQGKATDEDMKGMAFYERMQQLKGSPLAETAMQLPRQALEAFIGGKTLSALGVVGEGAAQGGLGQQALTHLGRGGAFVATQPSIWAPEYGKQRMEGATPLEAGGKTLAMAGIQAAVFGTLGKIPDAIPGTGVGGWLARTAAGTAAGIAEQQTVDVLASAAHLDTGYGVIGDLVRGKGDEALAKLSQQALGFGVFSALHGGKSEPLKDIAAEMQKAKQDGLTPEETAEKVRKRLEGSGQAWTDFVQNQRDLAESQVRDQLKASDVPVGDHDAMVADYLAAKEKSGELPPVPPNAPEPPTPDVETMRKALKALGINSTKMAPEKVLSEAKRLGIDKAIEKPTSQLPPQKAATYEPTLEAPEITTPSVTPPEPITAPQPETGPITRQEPAPTGQKTPWHDAYEAARRAGKTHEAAAADADKAHADGQTWVDSGTNFDQNGYEYTRPDGERFRISAKQAEGAVSTTVMDKDGKEVGFNSFNQNPDGTWHGEFLKSNSPGAARAMYDFMSRAGAHIVPSEPGKGGVGRSKEGEQFWQQNAEFATGLRKPAVNAPALSRAEIIKENMRRRQQGLAPIQPKPAEAPRPAPPVAEIPEESEFRNEWQKAGLTEDEMGVMRGLLQRRSLRSIAEDVGVSHQTVANWGDAIRGKLQAHFGLSGDEMMAAWDHALNAELDAQKQQKPTTLAFEDVQRGAKRETTDRDKLLDEIAKVNGLLDQHSEAGTLTQEKKVEYAKRIKAAYDELSGKPVGDEPTPVRPDDQAGVQEGGPVLPANAAPSPASPAASAPVAGPAPPVGPNPADAGPAVAPAGGGAAPGSVIAPAIIAHAQQLRADGDVTGWNVMKALLRENYPDQADALIKQLGGEKVKSVGGPRNEGITRQVNFGGRRFQEEHLFQQMRLAHEEAQAAAQEVQEPGSTAAFRDGVQNGVQAGEAEATDEAKGLGGPTHAGAESFDFGYNDPALGSPPATTPPTPESGSVLGDQLRRFGEFLGGAESERASVDIDWWKKKFGEALAPVGAMWDSLRVTFAPASVSEYSEATAGNLRQRTSEFAQRNDVARRALYAAKAYFDRAVVAIKDPVERTKAFLAFTNAYEAGQAQNLSPEQQAFAAVIKNLKDKVTDELSNRGLLQSFIDNHLGHLWKDPRNPTASPDEMAARVTARRPLPGGEGFRKQRSMPTWEDGINAGLEPATWNPIDAELTRLNEMYKSVFGHDAFNEEKDTGRAQFVRTGANGPVGWVPLQDKVARVFTRINNLAAQVGTYYMPEESARLMERYLQPGLRGNAIFDAAAGLGNEMNKMNLGWSAYHAVGTAINSQISALELGLRQVLVGKFGQSVPNLIKGIVPFSASISDVLQGTKLGKEWYQPGSQGAEMANLAEMFNKAGGRAHMGSEYQFNAIEKFREAIRQKAGAYTILKNGLFALNEAVSYPIMGLLVPRAKMGAWMNMARFAMEDLGPNATPDQQRQALYRQWQSVENRMGQMTYDNLFWNRTMRDLLHLSVRSVGWNAGDIGEFGGAAADVPSSIKNLVSGKGISPRLAYAVALPIAAGINGAILQYLFTGKGPEESKDYFFPKTGKLRPDGSPDRLAMPTYMKDFYALGQKADKGPFQWAENTYHVAMGKRAPLISNMTEMLSNQDFYGKPIRNPADPLTQQAMDEANHFIGGFEPFAFRQQKGESGMDQGLAFAGLSPAPAYITRGEGGEKVEDFYDQLKRAQTAHQQVLQQRQRGLATPGYDAAQFANYRRLEMGNQRMMQLNKAMRVAKDDVTKARIRALQVQVAQQALGR